jgi:NADH-quinone oxidoreductase subunit A
MVNLFRFRRSNRLSTGLTLHDPCPTIRLYNDSQAEFQVTDVAHLCANCGKGMSFNLIDYLPVLLMFVVAAGFAITFIGLSQLVGQRNRTRTKLMPYECGKDPVGSARERFSVKFYLIAMLFILFDIEVIFLVPWAVVFKRLSSPEYGLSNVVFFEMIVFIVLLAAGLIYVIKKGALDWTEGARREAEAEARLLELAEKPGRSARAA